MAGLLNLVLGHSSNLDPFDWIISQIEVSVLAMGHQQVTNDLVVDFYIRYFDAVVVLRVTTDGREHVIDGQHTDPWVGISAQHGVSLATPSGTIRKHTCVEARGDAWDQMLGCVLVHLSLCDILEDLVKVVSLLLTAVEDVWSDACQLSPQEHSIQDDQELILG